MKNFRSHFKFNKEERSGIFFLLLIIVLLQVVYFFVKSNVFATAVNNFEPNLEEQVQIDALKQEVLKKDSVKLYPFNPNFITDYKGYTLGMSVGEIDRLHTFRETDAYVNSAEEFQKVTEVSDSLLQTMSPFFKFPEWTQKRRQSSGTSRQDLSKRKTFPPLKEAAKVMDINLATVEDLKGINGIGEKLSTRIIKFRDRLGGFMSAEQLYDVYGLEADVAERALQKFKVLKRPNIALIKINKASAYQISKLIYIKHNVADKIVMHRENNGSFTSFSELTLIDGFPSEKLDRISLYLSLD